MELAKFIGLLIDNSGIKKVSNFLYVEILRWRIFSWYICEIAAANLPESGPGAMIQISFFSTGI